MNCIKLTPNRPFKSGAARPRTFASKVVWLRQASALRQMPLNSVLGGMRLLAVVVALLVSMDSRADWLSGEWKIDETATREANIEWHDDFVWKQIRSSCLLSGHIQVRNNRYILRNECADIEWDTEYTSTPLGDNRLSLDLENKHSFTVWKTKLGFCSYSNKMLAVGPNLEAIPIEEEEIPHDMQFKAEDQTRACWARD